MNDDDINSESKKQVTVKDETTTKTDAQNETITLPLIPSFDPQKLASIPTLVQSGNSCAYHALKNATDILCMLQKPQILEMLENGSNFEAIITRMGEGLCGQKSIDKVNRLFNEKDNSGEWREIIQRQRRIPVLKQCIKAKLLQSVPRVEHQQIAYKEAVEEWEKTIQEYEPALKEWNAGLINIGKEFAREYCQANPRPQKPVKPVLPLSILIEGIVEQRFNDITHACASQLVNTNVPIVLPPENIDLQELLVDILRKDNPARLNGEGLEESYRQCITLLNAGELNANFGNEMDQDRLLRNAPRRNELIIANDLRDDELQRLIDNGNVRNAESISIITNAEEFRLNELPSIKNKMDTDTYMHAFLIRSGFSKVISTLEDEIAQSNNGTHWVCTVLYRVKNENHYISADSYKGDKFKAQLEQDRNALIEQLES